MKRQRLPKSNVTSRLQPAIREIDKAFDADIAGLLMDAIEKRLSA